MFENRMCRPSQDRRLVGGPVAAQAYRPPALLTMPPVRDSERGRFQQASQGEREPYQDSSDASPNVMGIETLVTDGDRSGFRTVLWH